MEMQINFRIDQDRMDAWEEIKKRYYLKGLNPPILSRLLRSAFDKIIFSAADSLEDPDLVKKLKSEARLREYGEECSELIKNLTLSNYQDAKIKQLIDQFGYSHPAVKRIIDLNSKIASERGNTKQAKKLTKKLKKQTIFVNRKTTKNNTIVSMNPDL